MELVIDGSPTGRVLGLVANYLRLSSDKVVSVCKFSDATKKLLNLPELPRLYTKDAKVLTQPLTILDYLASKSKFATIVQNPDTYGRAQVDQWLDFALKHQFSFQPDDKDKEALAALNAHLLTRTFIASTSNLTLADLALFPSVHAWMKKASPEARLEMCNLTRWFDHLQHLAGVLECSDGLDLVPISQDASPKKEKDKAQKEGKGKGEADKAAAAAAEGGEGKKKKEGKEKKGGDAGGKGGGGGKAAGDDRPLGDVTRLEVRVGKIVKVWKHPEADKLWCEEIDIGEEKPRQIASGLVGFVPEEGMMNARVLVLANLKARPLVGFPSHGMVLCAKSDDGKKVELVRPPEGAKIGELVKWPGHDGEPEPQLNPKKKAFEEIQPQFRTDEKKTALFKDAPFTTSAGPCTVDSITNGSIS
uniref:tRNA-binding domain-containing protein n=1 Tax=Chromera velia CCMP2878 TaxID=1169474 RepID=A0A0G4HCH8_9ALVE|eukprot:Cvel_26126.t1-p1 / transcript=Cvel_26126.t1 / gene=Cvel_26126 / organism=Chromera_velia_CCMP2878 / gene_product=Probable methionine--tRNA ligase, putative / transcript_product=Probable methionine--tRNA ligase, putative / location=Cvel_scaffold3058:13335-18075(-) / protein_length=417 / sequence_SO=supercontig / SO=protein_coding / is_pseudo=false